MTDQPNLDLSAILALNAAHETQTSPLGPAALHTLLAQAFHVDWRPDGAILIALDQDADYASPNFRWFHARYDRFVYIDRVIVASAVRGRGLGRELYQALYRRAAARGYGLVCCEVNVVPPNPTSDAFHAAMGFDEVGRARSTGDKVVRYLSRSI